MQGIWSNLLVRFAAVATIIVIHKAWHITTSVVKAGHFERIKIYISGIFLRNKFRGANRVFQK